MFWVPVLLSLILSRAMYFCSSLRNLALVGWAGNKNQVGMESATALLVSLVIFVVIDAWMTHMAPQTTKMSWYGYKLVSA